MRVAIPSFFLILPAAIATHIRVFVPSSTVLPSPATLPPLTHATLTTLSHNYDAPLYTSNYFDFRNVSSGSYLLDIHCKTHVFAPLRVDVHDGSMKKSTEGEVESAEVQAWGTFRGNEWENKGEATAVQEVGGKVGIWGLEVRVLGPKDYMMERAGFSPLSILKNPMILIAIVSMVIVFGMPYIMDNMDDEMKAEFEERQKSSPLSGGQAANPLQNFDAAAWLAGSSGTSTSKKNEAAADRGVTR